MKQAPSKVLFLCRECNRRADGPDLRKYLRKRLKEDGLNKDVRIVRTECMGICPDDDLVMISAPGGPCRAVSPKKERDEIYEQLTEDL